MMDGVFVNTLKKNLINMESINGAAYRCNNALKKIDVEMIFDSSHLPSIQPTLAQLS